MTISLSVHVNLRVTNSTPMHTFRLQLSSSLGEDPYLMAFLNHLAPSSSSSTMPPPLSREFRRLLKQCLKYSSIDSLAALMPLASFQIPHTGKEGRHLSGGDLTTTGIWSLRFLQAHTNVLCAIESRIEASSFSSSASSCFSASFQGGGGDGQVRNKPDWFAELHPIPSQRISDISTHLNDWIATHNVDNALLDEYYKEPLRGRGVKIASSSSSSSSSSYKEKEEEKEGRHLNPLSMFLTLNNCPTPSQLKALMKSNEDNNNNNNNNNKSSLSIARLGREFPLTPMKTLLIIQRISGSI
jgi:hypothetical protein